MKFVIQSTRIKSIPVWNDDVKTLDLIVEYVFQLKVYI